MTAPTARGRVAELATNLAAVEERIARACASAGRRRSELTLIVVTKTWPAEDVRALAALGVRDVGESRDQEAHPKAALCRDLALTWHFVGRVQTNKARSIAEYAAVVHSVDRRRLVEALAVGARRAGRELQCLVQVSLDPQPARRPVGDDPGRGGAAPDDVPALADAVAAARGLRLAGVMGVAPLPGDPASAFDRLAAVSRLVRRAHPEAGIISAGMSGDLEQAIAAGATHLRIGTAILGARPPNR